VPTLGAPPESAPHPDWRVQSGPEARAPDFVNGPVYEGARIILSLYCGFPGD